MATAFRRPSLSETIDKLQSLLDGSEIRRLIVAGDLVESRRSCRRTDGDVATLTRWFKDRCVEFEPLAGNHDPPRGPARLLSMTVDGWTITHGDRPIKVRKTITGHLHPMLRARGHSAPCFLVGESSIVLPAFSRNAAGVDVQTMLGRAFRCVASTGEELLDFGPLVNLAKFFR